MTPIEQLSALYDSTETERSLEDDIELFLFNGYLISTPRYIIMGKPIIKGTPDDLIRDPRHRFEWTLCNCWFVYAYAGTCLDFWKAMPFELAWVAFHRRHARVCRYYPLYKFKERCERLTPFLIRT